MNIFCPLGIAFILFASEITLPSQANSRHERGTRLKRSIFDMFYKDKTTEQPSTKNPLPWEQQATFPPGTATNDSTTGGNTIFSAGTTRIVNITNGMPTRPTAFTSRPTTQVPSTSTIRPSQGLDVLDPSVYSDLTPGSYVLETGVIGVLRSSDFNSKSYSPLVDEVWVFQAEEGGTLGIHCPCFQLEESSQGCPKDFLQVFDVNSSSRFCGNGTEVLKEMIWTDDRTLVVWFHTDDSVQKPGFECRVVNVPDDEKYVPSPALCPFDCECGRNNSNDEDAIDPWLVSINIEDVPVQQGGIISDRHILTVNSGFLHDVTMPLLKVVVESDNKTSRRVKETTVVNVNGVEVTLLELKDPLELGPRGVATPMCFMSSPFDIFMNSMDFSMSPEDYLPLITEDKCTESMYRGVPATQECLNGRRMAVGLAGNTCCDRNKTDFIFLAEFLPWIEALIHDAPKCVM